MERTKREIQGIRKAIDKLNADVRELAQEVIEDAIANGVNIADALMERVSLSAELANSLSSDIAQSAYNSWRVADIGETTETTSFSKYDAKKFEAAANTAAAKHFNGGTPEEVLNIIMSRVEYDVVDTYANTIFINARKDPKNPKYARVPGGNETCKFCIMLASRGFVYASGKAGQKVHNHANCQCVYVCSWDKNPTAQGYDPREWYAKYQENLQGHELEEHYDLQMQRGKITKRLYKTAAYDYKAALKKK